MRKLLVLFPVVCLLVVGCTQERVDPSETPEIIRILEEEDIDSISTSHAQEIDIFLKDGRHFHGNYVQKYAGKYANNEELFDILNLVVHIEEKRSVDEDLSWSIIAE